MGVDAEYGQLVIPDWRDRRLLDPLDCLPDRAATDGGRAGRGACHCRHRWWRAGLAPRRNADPDASRDQVSNVRTAVEGPLDLNFFCHLSRPEPTADRTGRLATETLELLA